MKPNICPQAHRSVNAVRVLEASVAGLGSGTGNLPSGMLAKDSRQTWSDCFGGQKTCLPGSMERSPPPSCAVPAQLQLCYGFKPTWSRCALTAGAQQCGILYLKSPANIVKNDTHLLLDSRAFCTQLIRLNWNLFFFPSFLFPPSLLPFWFLSVGAVGTSSFSTKRWRGRSFTVPRSSNESDWNVKCSFPQRLALYFMYAHWFGRQWPSTKKTIHRRVRRLRKCLPGNQQYEKTKVTGNNVVH